MPNQHQDAIRQAKVERLRQGGRPRLIDLFSGCGGLSLGFNRAGFDIIANVEFDPHAAKAHARNFHADEDRHAVTRDITQVEPEALLASLGLDAIQPDQAADVLIGGPPCQAYTRIGRAKLREIYQHPEAYLNDPRGDLFQRYLHYIEQMKPLAVVMENVPDSLNYGGANIPDEVAETLTREWGYSCRYTLLNAIHYGVPQYRERMILIALAPELNAEPVFPTPTHWEELPDGYQLVRKVLAGITGYNQRQQTLDDLTKTEEGGYLILPPRAPEGASLPPPVTAKQALGGLPPVDPEAQSAGPVPYPNASPLTAYDREMREWPRFEAGPFVQNQITRSQPRDYPIFRAMPWGAQYPDAHRIAVERFEQHLAALGSAAPTVHSPEWEALKKEFVPPYDPTKFPNKWRKMEQDAPARTLMAHLGKDTYSHIHYEHGQARTITVREAARLQSFPDGFWFPASMNAAYRMIGNAVPPLMSYAIARQLRWTMEEAVHQAAFAQQ